jgi:hypothetical protein
LPVSLGQSEAGNCLQRAVIGVKLSGVFMGLGGGETDEKSPSSSLVETIAQLIVNDGGV